MSDKKLLSFSAVDLFHQCERHYYYDRVMKLPGADDTLALTVGLVYHDFLARVMRSQCALLEVLINEAIATKKQDLARLSVDETLLRGEMLERFNALRDLFGNRLFKPLIKGVPQVEQRFVDEELGYTGVIDLVCSSTPVEAHHGVAWQDEPCVLDYKVVTGTRSRSQRDTDTSPQLALYALHTGVNRAGFIEIPRNLEKPIKFHTTTYTQLEKERWRAWLKDTAAAILSRGPAKEAYRMASRSNGLCSPRWCPRWDLCYGGKDAAVQVCVPEVPAVA